MKRVSFIMNRRLFGFITTATAAATGLPFFFPKKTAGDPETKISPDAQQRQKIDPALFLYKESSAPLETGLTGAHAIAVDSRDRIYVGGGLEIWAFDSPEKKLALTIHLKRKISALTVSADGTLFAGLQDHIETYDPSGHLKEQWQPDNPKSYLTAIGVWKETVFVADAGNRTVLRYGLDGKKKDSFGDFVLPSFYFDLAISKDGVVHVVNTGEHRIESYSPEGNMAAWWGEYSTEDSTKFCGCCNPVHIDLLPNDGGFVTCEKGITRVKIYDNAGKFIGFVAGSDHFSQHDRRIAAPNYSSPVGLDVAVDSNSQILILDPALAQVRTFTRI